MFPVGHARTSTSDQQAEQAPENIIVTLAKNYLNSPGCATMTFTVVGTFSIMTGTTTITSAVALAILGLLIDIARSRYAPSPHPTHPLGWPSVDERKWVRIDTFQTVCRNFEIKQDGDASKYFSGKLTANKTLTQDQLRRVHYFQDPSERSLTDKLECLFGPLEVLANPISMDYNQHWKRIGSRQQSFYVHHAAADGAIDDVNYVNRMEQIFRRILFAQSLIVIASTDEKKHVVWFPFGMGDALKNLDDLSKLRLREELAEHFFNQVENFDDLYVHLCLPYDERKPANDETSMNYRAFTNILSKRPNLKQRVKLCVNVDAVMEAQRYANEKGPFTISLVNDASRRLIGNHWFGSNAINKMDENIHRRSSEASTYAFWWNQAKKDAAGTITKLHRSRLPEENFHVVFC